MSTQRSRRDTNHDALAVVAFGLAREHGLDGFTVDDVAREAGISRRTFFNHFAAKEQAVCEFARIHLRAVLDQVIGSSELVGCDPREMIDAAIRVLLSPPLVADLRALAALAKAHVTLVPYLAVVQHEAADQVAHLIESVPPPGGEEPLADLPLAVRRVLLFAIPGAVLAAVSSVYVGRYPLREIDGDVPGAVSTDEIITALRLLLPDTTPAVPA
ncbi:TetR/AcrR family transcriptional regulator [Cellulomonas composti]|uniref:TetR/AcrR family transcriptional regulator n=1 Tax=Cellulomonas composti TaxID=266130 RepID=UPI0011BE9E83|nr:TetR/AcrR family transcriptional regulator [Cellulomonas composti]